jgi:hypothetical protein
MSESAVDSGTVRDASLRQLIMTTAALHQKFTIFTPQCEVYYGDGKIAGWWWWCPVHVSRGSVHKPVGKACSCVSALLGSGGGIILMEDEPSSPSPLLYAPLPESLVPDSIRVNWSAPVVARLAEECAVLRQILATTPYVLSAKRTLLTADDICGEVRNFAASVWALKQVGWRAGRTVRHGVQQHSSIVSIT